MTLQVSVPGAPILLSTGRDRLDPRPEWSEGQERPHHRDHRLPVADRILPESLLLELLAVSVLDLQPCRRAHTHRDADIPEGPPDYRQLELPATEVRPQRARALRRLAHQVQVPHQNHLHEGPRHRRLPRTACYRS